MADPIFIIDGDNVAHARGPGSDYAASRERLIADVAGWAARSGVEAVVVLDGHGADRRISRTVVRFSRRESADTVVERLAYRQAAGREVVVVSSDTVVRHVAQRGGVQAMSAREFLDRVGTATPSESTERSPERRARFQLGDALDPAVRAALERLRRGE
jgi:predicted RNA-binding protein with PIN domain